MANLLAKIFVASTERGVGLFIEVEGMMLLIANRVVPECSFRDAVGSAMLNNRFPGIFRVSLRFTNTFQQSKTLITLGGYFSTVLLVIGFNAVGLDLWVRISIR